jgi:cell division septum initiation protein DivIVA
MFDCFNVVGPVFVWSQSQKHPLLAAENIRKQEKEGTKGRARDKCAFNIEAYVVLHKLLSQKWLFDLLGSSRREEMQEKGEKEKEEKMARTKERKEGEIRFVIEGTLNNGFRGVLGGS